MSSLSLTTDSVIMTCSTAHGDWPVTQRVIMPALNASLGFLEKEHRLKEGDAFRIFLACLRNPSRVWCDIDLIRETRVTPSTLEDFHELANVVTSIRSSMSRRARACFSFLHLKGEQSFVWVHSIL